MTTTIDRSFVVHAPLVDVWGYLDDHRNRARAITTVEGVEIHDDGTASWDVRVPGLGTVNVDTEDVEREPPNRVRFLGSAAGVSIDGSHDLRAQSDRRTRVDNRFVVDSKLPLVERFFESNIDSELESLRHDMEHSLDCTIAVVEDGVLT